MINKFDNSGLYKKYNVSKTNGSVNDNAKYFVLNYAQDEYAREALRFYVHLIQEEDPRLALDLLEELEKYE